MLDFILDIFEHIFVFFIEELILGDSQPCCQGVQSFSLIISCHCTHQSWVVQNEIQVESEYSRDPKTYPSKSRLFQDQFSNNQDFEGSGPELHSYKSGLDLLKTGQNDHHFVKDIWNLDNHSKSGQGWPFENRACLVFGSPL